MTSFPRPGTSVQKVRPCRNGRPTGPSASEALTSSSSWPLSSSPPDHLPPRRDTVPGMLVARVEDCQAQNPTYGVRLSPDPLHLAWRRRPAGAAFDTHLTG